ncbi:hypothetical protein JMY81_08120 [Brenneria goodwinii]|uniref:Orf24 n=1 Tax=Brenneria goodwinii TaxID=1109412 RepID=A0A0G4JRZ5_9GAMM|nr:RNase A-like domain-containing protein [Brenneria goodwinii]MCG8156159.1 hypothetical protein [Brenneria goodwinii]MCG8160804.1 hypothetical protein [Brenneria goodwinii]MCG8165866.1 hypothetical protein [Brenneria goodwinii]MCG8170354.1 hypothetical protein [Brenneria goodwinii]MCG8175222.1 hypothetical protein [Brenneria goodwinii]
MSEKLQVALSPVQLAAVLSDQSVTEAETLSNRLLGGLGVALGAVELAGATALCLVPEPTTLTKIGCVVVGTHSLDSINAAANQVITGRDTRTATYESAMALAKQFGADDSTAWKIGLTVDIAVPVAFALAIGAVRVASVRAGRVRLIEHESLTGAKPGGHTLQRHVGLSKDDLLARLEATATARYRPSGASSFYSVDVAERAISQAMRANAGRIKQWSHYPHRPLDITHAVNYPVGIYIRRGTTETVRTSTFKVVLEYQTYHGKPYYILTAYPTW